MVRGIYVPRDRTLALSWRADRTGYKTCPWPNDRAESTPHVSKEDGSRVDIHLLRHCEPQGCLPVFIEARCGYSNWLTYHCSEEARVVSGSIKRNLYPTQSTRPTIDLKCRSFLASTTATLRMIPTGRSRMYRVKSSSSPGQSKLNSLRGLRDAW